MFDCSRVVALLLAKFGQGDATNATHQERKMAEAFERVLPDAAYCGLTVEDEEDIEEDNDKKMDIDWDIDFLLTLMLSNSLLVLCLRCYVGIEGNVTEKLLPDPATHMCSYELRDPCKFSVPAYYKIYSVEDHLSEHCWGLRGRYVCSCRSDLCNGDIKLMQRKWADSPITDEKIRDCVQEYLKTRPDLEHPQNTTEASATDAYKPPAETANPSESHDFYRVRHKFLHTILSNTTAVEFNVTA
ncbi:hypothetical protein Y032_0011g1268 [Ancylostoma ceylanicum]|uniref:Uncharacterized protein n=1 Tax=Ancylostoma ceylanicum TaxID=53326 RepID=A0A016VDU7_9BILA|nr:hypothetical protein Y032_0011g1268 [Ancylostoma ceylanicum]